VVLIIGVDRKAGLPLYMQFKKEILGKIKSGELKAGDIIATESDLCKEYGISRYPIRQAMDELREERYIVRKRGRGTFVSEYLPVAINNKKVLGIILPSLISGFSGQILYGYEKFANERGYLVTVCSTNDDAAKEDKCMTRMIDNEVNGISLYPSEGTNVMQKLGLLNRKNIYFGLIDRNPGLSDTDYVGSDNIGGAYSAVRHMAMQGYENTVFISDRSNVSSIDERLLGYLKAVNEFKLKSITHIDIKEDLSGYSFWQHRVFLNDLREDLINLKANLPLGILAANDGVALQCMRIFKDEGMKIGSDIGIIGFDNIPECEYANVPLTSVAQNGRMMGEEAAKMAIERIEGISRRVSRSIMPTQLVTRRSCNEGDSIK
jgi:GntR family transcriptional regulator, arabinose operon transcriptional repressor